MDQYMPPVDLDAPMRGVVCGTVLKSNHPAYAEGTIVSGIGLWADYQIGTPDALNPMGDLGPLVTVDGFSTFAVIGPTAYFGLLDIGKPEAGATVVISGTTGAVGSIIGEIAKIKDCCAMGIAGTNEKCRWIKNDLGFDAAINYRRTFSGCSKRAGTRRSSRPRRTRPTRASSTRRA